MRASLTVPVSVENLLRSFVASLLWGIALATAGLAQAPATLPPIVEEAISKHRQECLPERFDWSSSFITVKDINGDKRDDYILDYGKATCGDFSSYWCGTAGCHTEVFASRDDGSFVIALEERVRQLRFRVVNKRPAMVLDLHGSYCGRAGVERCGLTLYWNGVTFSSAN
jgi:hypothetical protein